MEGKTLPPEWKYQTDPVTGIKLKLSGLQDGAYHAYWYSPNLGQWLLGVDVSASGGEVILDVPVFQGDLALKLLPAGQPGPTVP